MKRHWTSESSMRLAFSVGMDFISLVENAMEERDLTQKDLARILGLTEGRVSQIINNPGNLTIKTIVEWSSALGMKATIFPYEDGDANNTNGPIIANVFLACWDKLGKPTAVWDLADELCEKSTLSGSYSPNSENSHRPRSWVRGLFDNIGSSYNSDCCAECP